MAKIAVKTKDDVAKHYEDQIAQLEGQIAVLNERNRDLAGFQGEARDLRQAVVELMASLEAERMTVSLANAEAAAARSELKNSRARADTDVATVEAAHQLAAALKKLIA